MEKFKIGDKVIIEAEITSITNGNNIKVKLNKHDVEVRFNSQFLKHVEKPFEPRVMLVWDSDEGFAEEEFVEGVFKGQFIVSDGASCYLTFKNAKDLPKELENGKVYKHTTEDIIAYKTDTLSGFGFWSNEFVSDNGYSFEIRPDNWQEYPLEDFKELILKECERRGFKEGAYIKNHQGEFTLTDLDLVIKHEPHFGFYTRQGAGIWLFVNGDWAKVVPTMTKKEAEEKLGAKIVG